MATKDETGIGIGIGIDRLDESVIFNLGRAHDSLVRSMGRVLAEHGIQPHRMALITLIAERPGITPGAATEIAGRDKSTLTPIIRDLEQKGLIRRRRSDEDRRSFGMELTDHGRQLMRFLNEVQDTHEREIVRLLGTEAVDLLLAQLRTIQTSFRNAPVTPESNAG